MARFPLGRSPAQGAGGGWPSVPIAEILRVEGASWGDDDVIVLSMNDGPLYTVPASGGVPVAVPNTEDGNYVHPWVLPGAEAVLARMNGPEANADGQVAVVDLMTGEADVLAVATRIAYASGYLVMSTADGTLLAQPFDVKKRQMTGQAVAILDGVETEGPAIGEYAVSMEGGLAYQAGGGASDEALVILGQAGPVEIPLSEGGDLEGPAFSPDGRRVVAEINTDGTPNLWIWDRDQQTQQLLTVEGELNFTPVWTPDGARIAFGSVRDGGSPQIYWQAADGSDVAELLFAHDGTTSPGSWTPDGAALTVVAIRTHGEGGGQPSPDIGLLTLADSTVRWLLETDAAEFHPEVSPDGTWLAYTSDRSGQAEVYVQALDGTGGQIQVSAGGGFAPRWSPDGTTVYFATSVSSPIMAAAVRTDGGFRVTGRAEAFQGPNDFNGLASINWDVGPAGDEFLYIGLGGLTRAVEFIWVLNWPEIVRGMTSGN